MARRPLATIRAASASARAALVAAGGLDPANPNHLGDLAWWDPISSWRRDVSSVRAAFLAHGLDPDATLPGFPDWQVAFGRAVQVVRTRIRERDFTLLDAAAGPNGERRVAIVSVARNGRVSTDDQGTVTCPKDGAAPFVERDDPSGIAQEIVSCAHGYFGHYTSADIVAAVVQTFERWAALPCRACPPHVVYWVPPAGGDVVRRLSDAVEAIGWGRIELFAGYRTDARSSRAVASAVNEGLESQLKAFSEQVAKYADTDPSKTRVSTIESKIEEAKRLREQGALYREILGAAVTSIDDRILNIETALLQTLGMVEAAHAA
jgi:hypothetical protein